MSAPAASVSDKADERFMSAAIAFARRGLGLTAPNPAVGSIVVKDGVIIGRGATQPGGRPHAETVALADAGEAARGATLYVTLEPCSHHGKTGPCAHAIVQAGIARVVSAIEDPDLLRAASMAGLEINPVGFTEIETLIARLHSLPPSSIERARQIMRPASTR